MNKVKKKVYRNTTSFNMMAWGSFAFFVILMLVGLYTLKEPLIIKKMKKTITNSSHNKLSNNKKRSLKRLFLFAENAQIFGLFPSGSVIME